jgi:tetratricopeptide (TPR) repeat protein
VIAPTLTQFSFFLQSSRDFAGAKPLCERALAILPRLEDWTGAAWEQSRLGDIERQLGNLDADDTAYERALAAFERLGDRVGLAGTKVDAAVLLFEQ